MLKPKIGFVGVTCKYESGGERADELMSVAEKELIASGVEVYRAKKVVWDAVDALEVCHDFAKQQLDALVIMDITWVLDSTKYLFINELKLPTVFWAVPYTETFSIGCVHHFGSILTSHNIPYKYVYGASDDKAAIDKVCSIARVGQVIKKIRKMHVALLGPRQTWRVAGPQDMTNEEWEFSKHFGTTIVHIEMSEVIDKALSYSDAEAEKTLKDLSARTGKVLADKDTMLYMAKIYLSVKDLIASCDLSGIAAECYPQFSGLMNLTSSWLADEGFILDTEGDISHTVVMKMLNMCAGGGPTILGEVGSYDDVANYLAIAHEGSTAHSAAESIDKVQISPSGENGTFVGVPIKPMPVVTVASIQGSAGNYQMLIAKGRTLPVTHEEWVEGGSKLLVHLQFEKKPSQMVREMMEAGLDHHLLIKEGDYTEMLCDLCDFMGVKKVLL